MPFTIATALLIGVFLLWRGLASSCRNEHVGQTLLLVIGLGLICSFFELDEARATNGNIISAHRHK